MKKIIISLIAFGCTYTAIAQGTPEGGTSSLTFNITGLADVAIGNFGNSLLEDQPVPDPLLILGEITVEDLVPQNMLMYKKYYDNEWASRLGFGINSVSSKNISGDSTGFDLGYATTETKLSAFSVGLSLGIEKHMGGSGKVDPYLGVELNLAYLGKINFNQTTDYSDTTVAVTTEFDASYKGGLGFGVNLLGGFDYFFSENISIGGEAGIGFSSVSVGGDYESTTTSASTPGTTTTFTDDGTVKSSQSGIGVNSYGGVTLSIYW